MPYCTPKNTQNLDYKCWQLDTIFAKLFCDLCVERINKIKLQPQVISFCFDEYSSKLTPKFGLFSVSVCAHSTIRICEENRNSIELLQLHDVVSYWGCRRWSDLATIQEARLAKTY